MREYSDSVSDTTLSQVRISRSALEHNLQTLRGLVGRGTQLAPMIKANAYGHGLLPVAQTLRETGAEYLAVNALYEARALRQAGDTGRIYIAGYTPLADLPELVALGCETVVYSAETVQALGAAGVAAGTKARVHLKVETGTHRQGVAAESALELASFIRATPGVQLVGVSMHFANIEDTTDHTYARTQLTEFQRIIQLLESAGHTGLLRHSANSAATLLWDQAHFELVRPGLAVYGMWPSEETFVSLATERRESIQLLPALTWQTCIAQVKEIPQGAKVGYGCTWEAARPTRLAILPVGYYDGYVRAYSSCASVLVQGQRAPVVGRVCMNITMIDITDIPEVRVEDEVVLLGRQGEEDITAEELGQLSGTINYEVTTRIRESIPRISA